MTSPARIIAAYLEESGDRYDLANSASIKVLAMDLQKALLTERLTEPLWEAMDCPDVTDDPFYDDFNRDES